MHSLPRLTDRTALFLDFDGTLVDIAPRPELVWVPPVLPDLLQALRLRLGGALAIVSGRRMAELDQFLHPLVLPLASEHGARRRDGCSQLHGVNPPDLRVPAEVLQRLVQREPGLQLEQKDTALALHYRHAPALEGLCHDTLTTLLHGRADLALLHGKQVFELKPAGPSKGLAIEAFMQEPSFAGRTPLFAGDDLTDESGFAAVQALGGQGIKVGAGPTQAALRCANPTELRAWLAGLLETQPQ